MNHKDQPHERIIPLQLRRLFKCMLKEKKIPKLIYPAYNHDKIRFRWEKGPYRKLPLKANWLCITKLGQTNKYIICYPNWYSLSLIMVFHRPITYVQIDKHTCVPSCLLCLGRLRRTSSVKSIVRRISAHLRRRENKKKQ